MIKSITIFFFFFVFQQLKSQISKIDQIGYNPFCDDTFQIIMSKKGSLQSDGMKNKCPSSSNLHSSELTFGTLINFTHLLINKIKDFHAIRIVITIKQNPL